MSHLVLSRVIFVGNTERRLGHAVTASSERKELWRLVFNRKTQIVIGGTLPANRPSRYRPLRRTPAALEITAGFGDPVQLCVQLCPQILQEGTRGEKKIRYLSRACFRHGEIICTACAAARSSISITALGIRVGVRHPR